MQPVSGGRTSHRTFDQLSGAIPLFVIGWREVFVPLAVVLHNQHGSTLAVAGLAIAASRLGGWLHAKGSFRRPPYEAALLGGIALLLLGLAPEEGPVGLLLWFVFGVTWPILQEALAARFWQGRAGAAVLLTGMIVAGPLASGPGTWLIAGCFFFLAWRIGPTQAASAPLEAEIPVAHEPPARSDRGQALPFLFSFASLMWIWLIPAQLIDLGLAPQSFGILVAAGWLARLGGAWMVGRQRLRLPRGTMPTIIGLGLLVALGLIASAHNLWQLVIGMIVYGALIGIVGVYPTIERPELGRLPGRAQALGEVLGPLAGVAAYLLGGPLAVFASAALATIALSIVLLTQPRKPTTLTPDTPTL